MMEKTIAAFLVFSLVSLQACKKDDNEVSYQNDVKPLLNARCISCHVPGGTADASGVFFDTYENTAAACAEQKNGTNRVLGAIKQTAGFTAMPESAPKLSDGDIGIIEDWINAGRPNN